EERLNFALEGSNDGLWDWQIQAGEIFYSPRWQTMIGYEPGEIEPTIESWEKLVHPDDLSRVNEVMNAHLEGKTPQYEAEYRVQSKSGEWVWILARGKIADYDENGTPKRFVGTHVDVTERKNLEEEIANQLSFIESLVDTIPNPLFVYGVDQKFITFNKEYEEAFGIKRGDYIGKTVMDMDFLPLETREATQREDASLIASGGEINREVQSKFVDEKDHDVIYQVKTFDLPGGERAGLMGLMTDISELKELERQLKIANERMSVELNFAREIQMSMLPLIFPAFPLRKELTVFATLHPAREVGGDFYDFYFLDDDYLCFVIGDVAGKGAPGALLMAVSKTLIKSRAMDDSSPSSILTHVNNELSEENESAMFVTVFLGILNVKTGELVYTNGGHNPPYIKRGDGTLQKLDAFHGPVIGAMPELTYKQDRDTLRKDDVILLYTDGVTEALDEKDQLYSDPKLVELLLAQQYKSPKEMVDT
ncbi:MAG: SpoIIE family protein phosphatase, partial [Anaerolineales bacterium]|nr:SpoIIE family protein phosphatase [Anaerolineales bacterium]